MKKLILFTLIVITIILPRSTFGQIYGNTLNPDFASFSTNNIVWLKIETGPNDSGQFTHWGLYNHPTWQQDCDIKLALYTHNSNQNAPDQLLADDYIANPENGAFNQDPITNPPSLSPSTIYWMGIRTDCNYGSARVSGQLWPIPPLRFIYNYSFNSSWPDPVQTNDLSTQSSANLVAWWIVANNMVLPAELVSFDVKNERNRATLMWETATETNNSGWNIQRSENGFTWNTVGFVEGAYESTKNLSYDYEDDYNKGGLIFYRLEQVDLDGTKSYSDVASTYFTVDNLYLYPTTSQDYISIAGVEEDTEYAIYTADGIFVRKGKYTPRDQIGLTDLNNGMHFLFIKNEYLRFVKI